MTVTELEVKANEGEVQTERPGLFTRVLWTFISPGRLMKELAQKPRVLLGIVLSILTQEALYFLRMPLLKESMREAAAASAKLVEEYSGQEMTAQMIEKQTDLSLKMTLVSTPVSIILGMIFTAFIFFAILKIMGGQGKFKAYLSVVSYSAVISALYIVVLFGVSFITNSLHQDISLTSLALLAPDSMSGTFLYGILKGIDVFSIWRYSVMAIGFAAVSRIKKPYVYAVVSVVFVIGLVLAGGGELALGKLM